MKQKFKKAPTNTVKALIDNYAPITVPYNVWTVFGEEAKEIRIAGDQATLGCDYKSLPQLREAMEWYVAQLGGTVKWEA